MTKKEDKKLKKKILKEIKQELKEKKEREKKEREEKKKKGGLFKRIGSYFSKRRRKKAREERRRKREEQKKKNAKKKKEHKKKQKRYNQALSAYLNEAVHMGKKKGQIKKELIGSGWPRKFVKGYCDKFFRKNKKAIEEIKRKRQNNEKILEMQLEDVSHELKELK